MNLTHQYQEMADMYDRMSADDQIRFKEYALRKSIESFGHFIANTVGFDKVEDNPNPAVVKYEIRLQAFRQEVWQDFLVYLSGLMKEATENHRQNYYIAIITKEVHRICNLPLSKKEDGKEQSTNPVRSAGNDITG